MYTLVPLPYEEIIEYSPFNKVRTKIKEPHVLPKTIQKENIEKIIQYLFDRVSSAKTDFQTIISIRNIAIIGLLFSTGIRISELCNIKVADINFNEKTLKIFGKGSKERILYIGGKEQLPIYDLLFVGRLVEQKAPQMFIEIVGKLKQSGRSIKCAMVGTGDLEKMCRELIEQNGLQSSIELLGFQENPYLYMRMSKLLCMTSRWEGYGLVAAEANILGIPVLSTKTGGVTELFGEKAEELCNGSDDFFEKIQKLLSDSELYQIWKMRALKRAKEFTSPKEYAEKLSLIYKKEMMNQ